MNYAKLLPGKNADAFLIRYQVTISLVKWNVNAKTPKAVFIKIFSREFPRGREYNVSSDLFGIHCNECAAIIVGFGNQCGC